MDNSGKKEPDPQPSTSSCADANPAEPSPEAVDLTSSTSKAERRYDWGDSTGQTLSGRPQKMEVSDEIEPEQCNEDTDCNEDSNITFIGERSALLFSLNTCKNIIEIFDDAFYELKAREFKLIAANIGSKTKQICDPPLVTAKQREIANDKFKQDQLKKYRNTIIRIQFPDRIVLQGIFNSTELVQDVYDFVKTYLAEDFNYTLYLSPPKIVPNRSNSLYDEHLVPKSILYFGLIDVGQETPPRAYLKTEFLSKKVTFNGAQKAAELKKPK